MKNTVVRKMSSLGLLKSKKDSDECDFDSKVTERKSSSVKSVLSNQGSSKSSGSLSRLSTRMDGAMLWNEGVDDVAGEEGKDGDEQVSDSELSETDHFLAKGAFLLTPSQDLSMEKAASICDKLNYRGLFTLTKTATGILFKFSDPLDYQATFKKGFHKVTGVRFYKKVPIPCRPQKTFTVFVLEVPEEVPEEDIRHSLYKFRSVVEVIRIPRETTAETTKIAPPVTGGTQTQSSTLKASTAPRESEPPPSPPTLIRVTLASLEEYNTLLQNGLDFYGATYFPTETIAAPGSRGGRRNYGGRFSEVVTTSGNRVRDTLPVFDASGFQKIAPPASFTIKPRQR